MADKQEPVESLKDYARQFASLGGKARARKYDKATLHKWAKQGGRPRKKWTELSPAGKLQRKYRQA